MTQAISLSGGGARNPSTTVPPVNSAIRRAIGGMPPPVTATILSRSRVGEMTSGPPQPSRPRDILTALYWTSAIAVPPQFLLELDALATCHESRDALGDDALEQDHDHADDEIIDRHRDVIGGRNLAFLLELKESDQHAAPDEIFAGIGVREEAENRVNERDRRVVEGGLMLFLEKGAERVGHRIRQEENRQDRQHRVPGQRDAAGRLR